MSMAQTVTEKLTVSGLYEDVSQDTIETIISEVSAILYEHRFTGIKSFTQRHTICDVEEIKEYCRRINTLKHNFNQLGLPDTHIEKDGFRFSLKSSNHTIDTIDTIDTIQVYVLGKLSFDSICKISYVDRSHWKLTNATTTKQQLDSIIKI